MISFSWSLRPALRRTSIWFWALLRQPAWQLIIPSLIFNSRAPFSDFGFIVHLDYGSFEVPQERWDNLQALIFDALSGCSRVQVHLLSKIAGHISSMIFALGPIAQIRSRQCHSYLQQHKMQYHAIISERLHEELLFWLLS